MPARQKQTLIRRGTRTEPDGLWLIRNIQSAADLAVQILAYGLADENGEVQDAIIEFAGNPAIDVEDFSPVANLVDVAFAVGVAVGQRLQANAFEVRGVR